ncbi:MAG: hypothetical protein WBE80_10170 [Methylocella sp.]
MVDVRHVALGATVCAAGAAELEGLAGVAPATVELVTTVPVAGLLLVVAATDDADAAALAAAALAAAVAALAW